MTSIETLREFLGWTVVVNVVVLSLQTIALLVAARPIKRFHAKLFGLAEDELSRAYFQYLAQYKIGVWIFSLAPYLALWLMT